MPQQPQARAKEKRRRTRRLAAWRARRHILAPEQARLFELLHRGHVAGVRALLEAGADPNVVDAEGHTPLEYAVRRARLGLVRELLASGANPEPALWAALWPCTNRAPALAPAVLKALLDAGADPNWRDDDQCAIYLAVKHPDLVRVLLQRGGDPNCATSNFETPLSFACDWGLFETVGVLLSGGADPNYVMPDLHWSLLMLSAAAGHAPIVAALLDAGADPKWTNERGQTAASVAMDHGRRSVVALLEERALS